MTHEEQPVTSEFENTPTDGDADVDESPPDPPHPDEPKAVCGGPNGQHRFNTDNLTEDGRRTCNDCGETEIGGDVFESKDGAPTDKPYREGDQEDAPQEQATAGDDGESRVVTGFLVVVYADGHVEAATKLKDFPCEREPGLRDIRDACASLNADITATIQANMMTQAMSRSVQAAMHAKQIAAVQGQLAGSGGMGEAIPPPKG